MDKETYIWALRERYRRFLSSTYSHRLFSKNKEKLFLDLERAFIGDEEIEKEQPYLREDYETAKEILKGNKYDKDVAKNEHVINFLGGIEEIVGWTNKDGKKVFKELKKTFCFSESKDVYSAHCLDTRVRFSPISRNRFEILCMAV